MEFRTYHFYSEWNQRVANICDFGEYLNSINGCNKTAATKAKPRKNWFQLHVMHEMWNICEDWAKWAVC